MTIKALTACHKHRRTCTNKAPAHVVHGIISFFYYKMSLNSSPPAAVCTWFLFQRSLQIEAGLEKSQRLLSTVLYRNSPSGKTQTSAHGNRTYARKTIEVVFGDAACSRWTDVHKRVSVGPTLASDTPIERFTTKICLYKNCVSLFLFFFLVINLC